MTEDKRFEIDKDLEETIEKLKSGELEVIDVNGNVSTIPEINKTFKEDGYKEHIRKLIETFGLECILVNHKGITERFINYKMD